MLDVVALGELLIDFAAKSKDPDGYPTMAANPGSAPGNFLAALNVYGKKTAFLGKVGADTFGHLLLGTLQKAGIETKGVIVEETKLHPKTPPSPKYNLISAESKSFKSSI